MKNLILFLFVIVVLTSCDSESGSGHVITQKRSTPAFTKLNVSEGIDAEVRKGAAEVKVVADDNLVDYVETIVENGTLRIGLKDNTNLHNTHIKVIVTAPEINAVKASSSASVKIKDGLNFSGTIFLDASSAANITTSVDAPGVDANASSGSEIRVSGRTKSLNANSSSGSSIKAFELLSETTKAEASSGAGIDVFASVSINANASSGANINYKGAASLVQKEESSGGSVNKAN